MPTFFRMSRTVAVHTKGFVFSFPEAPLHQVEPRRWRVFFYPQATLRTIQRLNLTLLIERKNDGPLGGMQIQPHDIPQLRDELESVDRINCFTRCGLRPCARQIRLIVAA